MYKRVLFVCTGNTCRSPLAEGLFRMLAKREGLDCEVRSAGVAALDGMPISKHSSDILKAKGIVNDMRSSALTAETAAWADLILTMTSGHKMTVIRQFPEAADKVFTLKEYAEDDPRVAEAIAERQRIYSEIQIKKALSQPVTPEELERAKQLDRSMPDFDIADPFGGDKAAYEKCADEIERYLSKLIRKLKENPAAGGTG